MRAGVIISAVSHIALVALALFGTPKLFDSEQLASIEVDLVRPEEIERRRKSRRRISRPTGTRSPQPSPPEPAPQAQAKQQQPPAATCRHHRSTGPVGQAHHSQQAQTPWIFDPVNIPALLDLPNAPDKGFDSEATTTANLPRRESGIQGADEEMLDASKRACRRRRARASCCASICAATDASRPTRC